MRSKLFGITLCVLAVLGMAIRTKAQNQQSRPLNTYEQAAIKVVSDWTAAWQAKDPDKMAQLVADDIKFRLDPSEGTFRTGREKFLCQMRRMAGGLIIKNPSYEAIGDKVYTLVIQHRTDVLQGRGGPAGGPDGAGRAAAPPGLAGDIPVGAFFIVRNGKIAEWLDSTLALDITTLPRAGGPGGGLPGCE